MKTRKDVFQGTCCKHCKNGVVLLDFSPEGVAKRREICAKCTDRPPIEEAFADLLACYIYIDTKDKDPEFKAQAKKVEAMVRKGYGIPTIVKETGISWGKVRRAIDLYGLRNKGDENVGRSNAKRYNPYKRKKQQAESADKGTE